MCEDESSCSMAEERCEQQVFAFACDHRMQVRQVSTHLACVSE